MGLRFRRSVRLLPGLRLNFSLSGVSTSLGGRGATINLSRRGVRTTFGLPGTGLSYSTLKPYEVNTSDAARSASGYTGVAVAAGVVVLICVVGAFHSARRPANSVPETIKTDEQVALPVPKPVGTLFVNAQALNCRTGPNQKSRVAKRLKLGHSFVPGALAGDWIQMADADGCWVKQSYLAALPPRGH